MIDFFENAALQKAAFLLPRGARAAFAQNPKTHH
jgi:hypothetical protein